MERLAELAGVHRATLYRHFPTRDDLVAAALEFALAEGRAIVEHVSRLPSSHDAVKALALKATEFGDRHGFLIGHRELLEAGPDPIGLSGLMSAWQGDGLVRGDVDPVVLAATFTAVSQVLFLQGLTSALVERAELLVTLFMEGARPRA